jgi:hypothetical protein
MKNFASMFACMIDHLFTNDLPRGSTASHEAARRDGESRVACVMGHSLLGRVVLKCKTRNKVKGIDVHSITGLFGRGERVT